MDSTRSSPSAKRVRWDESVPPDVPQTHSSGSAGGTAGSSDSQVARSPTVVPPSCSANEAIRISSVAGISPDASSESEDRFDREGFRPKFTHQLFDEERIEGFEEGSIKIRVSHTPTSLDFLVKIQTHDETSRCATDDVLSRLSKALPSGHFTTDEPKFYQELDGRGKASEAKESNFKPPGARVHEYKRGKKTFSVYRATGDDPGACEYHERAQCLAPWFIEAADAIDLTDDRWEVFYLFEEETPREVLGEKWRPTALVGYFTVFGFRNPVKGVSLRICQALVLPQFQRQAGHGQTLLSFLYGLARSRESVFEITVEDPAPGFEKVRNLVDARTLRDLDVFPAEVLSPPEFKRPSKDVVQAAHKVSKLTVHQVEIGFDILKACDVPEVEEATRCPVSASAIGKSSATPAEATSSPTAVKAVPAPDEKSTAAVSADGSKADEASVDDKRKRYRLMVKRRLLKRHGEELSTDSSTRKRQLDELYRDVEPGLLSLGSKLRKEQGSRGKQTVG
ncbi:unnamed protein product [Scytosiphon promiscuus]